MQTFLRLIYPAQCVSCGEMVEDDFALCSACWRDTAFIQGLTCKSCGIPLQGEETEADIRCDDCITIARPWGRGASALLYKDNGRKLVLSLKHGDRTEHAIPAGRWMAKVAPPQEEALVVPVPLHWLRFLKRRYNQSALLAKEVAKQLNLTYLPDGLKRQTPTKSLDGETRDARFAILENAIIPHPKRADQFEGRNVLLVDDVMTSGATLAAATEACRAAGAVHIDVLTLARVAKDL